MFLRYFPDDFQMVPVAPIITGITSVFTVHMRCISVVKCLYFRIYSASLLITFLSPQIAMFINTHVPSLFSRIMISSLLLEIVVLVGICLFRNVIVI
jgi:hypothetical protein